MLGTVFFLETGKGTLRIETNSDAKVPILIREGDQVVDRLTISQEGATTKLRAGNYVIEIADENAQLEVIGSQVTLKRGGEWIAKIATVENATEQAIVKPMPVIDSQQPIAIVLGKASSPGGNHIEIQSVTSTGDGFEIGAMVTVNGVYTLESVETADLCFYSTTTLKPGEKPIGTPIQSSQRLEAKKGTHTFTLSKRIRERGSPHITLYGQQTGDSIGGVYFSESDKSSKGAGLPHSLKAVAMVRVDIRHARQNSVGFFAIDRAGVLLRPGDFSPADTDRYLHIIVPGSYPTGSVGAEFGDSRVQAAARLARLLKPYREEIGISSIQVNGDPKENPVRDLEIVGRNGERWYWGSPPGFESNTEPSAKMKLQTLLAGAPSGSDLRRVQNMPSGTVTEVEGVSDIFDQPGGTRELSDTVDPSTFSPKAFATPESRMQYYADCQFRDDVAGCLECYSDKVVDQFAANYLVGATAMLEMYRKIPDDELQDMQRKTADELEELIERSMIDNAPTIAKSSLYQAAGSIREQLHGGESREPTQNELMLTAVSPSMLKNPRQFVLEFDALDETVPDESAKPERPKTYKIETDANGTWATETNEFSRIELKKIDGRWWIDGPWAEEKVDSKSVHAPIVEETDNDQAPSKEIIDEAGMQ